MGIALFFDLSAKNPDEGMWLPMYLKKLNANAMAKAGLKLTTDDLYNIEKASVKDAIVSLGGFCTAEIVSKEGLLLTNHHCAYDAIRSHSSVQNDYLTNGFWAMNQSMEIHTPGLTASILVRMEDVTNRIKPIIDELPAPQRAAKTQALYKEIIDEATKGTNYKGEVKAIFDGNQYILSVLETFKDIRLVGAPPSSVGKFGGDTDNWMWPRHTGDFAMLRIYAGKDNKPADFSTDNVPYVPKHSLPISLNGIKEGDYAMIMGFPGRTNRYLTSFELQSNIDYFYQSFIDLYEVKMTNMKAEMDKSDAVRIMMASDYASGMNAYKYYQGQSLGLKNDGLVVKKQIFEKELTAWINADASRKAKFGSVLNNIETVMKDFGPFNRRNLYYALGLLQNDVLQAGALLAGFDPILKEKKVDQAKLDAEVAKVRGMMDDLFKEAKNNIGRNTFNGLLKVFYKKMPKNEHPEIFNTIFARYKGLSPEAAFDKYTDDIYSNGIALDKARLEAFLNKPTAKALSKDLSFAYFQSVLPAYQTKIAPERGKFAGEMAKNRILLLEAMMQMQNDRAFYPDANSTFRVTYGNVKSYVPRDAVTYNFISYTDGILQKENPSDDEFIVPAKLKDLILKKDFGRYADQNGRMPVAFLSNNDITGGNSGSPVMDANGNLIGIAFDGNWESMTGDLMFSPDVQRTISVDIRYVLFIIDKYAGAGHLINEMNIVDKVLEEPNPTVKPATSEPSNKQAVPVKNRAAR